MDSKRRPSATRIRPRLFLLAAACVLLPRLIAAQGLTGALIGTVKDAQGSVLPGAVVRVSAPALIGGPTTLTTNAKGQLRFPALPPGSYVLEIELQGFTTYHEEDIHIGAGATIERTAELTLAGLAESVVVEGPGSRADARDSGFGTRFGLEDLKAIPTRRSSMFDPLRAAPGVSPTSPASGTTTSVSAFGSGTNENTFLFDGTNFTSPSNGVGRAEPGIDFIQEVQVQSVGASTDPDAAFAPFIIAPCFPSYPSAHGTLSSAASEVLERIYGPAGHDITFSNALLPGVVLHYTAFKRIIDDVDDARVFGGIHFRFDQEAGGRQGQRVGAYVYKHNLRVAHPE